MPKKNSNDFYIVTLTNNRKPFRFMLWLAIIGSFIVFFLPVYFADKISHFIYSRFFIDISLFVVILSFAFIIFGIIAIWVFYFLSRRKSKCKNPLVRKLTYFINANKLYEMDSRKVYDRNGNIVTEKYISNSVSLGFLEDSEKIIIRAYKEADVFNEKMNNLDNPLSALFGLAIDNKIDKISYCDYYFKKIQDKRIIITSENKDEIEINNSVNLPLNNNLSWNILKQPHLLLAGVTGSGKTTFLNYLIIEMLKMKSDVYICDPKRSDLSSLKHFFGEEHVASETNMIAKMTRIVKEIMNNRFIEYKENAEKFVYGYSFVDYGLKPIFIIFDELGAFRASADKKVFAETMDNLTEIILKGREMGVFCVLSTQQPNANNIPTELRDNLSVRLAMGNMSNEAYRMVFGAVDDLQTVNTLGGGYIYLDGLGWEKPKYFEAPFLDYKNFDFISEIKKYV